MIKIRNHRQIAAVLLVLSGLLSGMILPEVLHMGTGTYAGFTSMYSFRKFEESTVQLQDLFAYITPVRLHTLLFLWMSCFTAAGILFHLIYFWWLAVSAGMLLALFTLRDGWSGLMLFACCLMPQWILYAAMWKLELTFLVQLRKSSDVPADNLMMRRGGMLRALAKMVVLCVVGCACESLLGIQLLKNFLRKFM